MRLAIAGLGSAALRGHLPALSQLAAERDVALVAGADPNPSWRSLAAARGAGIRLYSDATTMLHEVRPDLLVVAAEPLLHASIAAVAARHEAHVLCEKPLTVERGQHDVVADAFVGAPVGLVLVQQYRYAPPWWWIVRGGRAAAQHGADFQLAVDIERDGVDALAASAWRSDLARSGGLLADHAVHFIALGRSITADLEPLTVQRKWHLDSREAVEATVRLGPGVLLIRASASASVRRTQVELRVGRFAVRWTDGTVVATAGQSVIRRWRVGALSSRPYVDALYLPLYRDVIGHMRDPEWRRRRLEEALCVDRTLLMLLEMAREDKAAR